MYNRVLNHTELAELANTSNNYLHTIGTVKPVVTKNDLIDVMKSAQVTEAHTNAIAYQANTSFTGHGMTHVLDDTGALFPASAVNYVYAHVLATGATKNPALLDPDLVGIISGSLVSPGSNLLPHVRVASVASTTNTVTVSGTVFSSIANIDTIKIAAFPNNYDLASATTFLESNVTSIPGVTSVPQYTVGEFSNVELSTVSLPTNSFSSGIQYAIGVIAIDSNQNKGISFKNFTFTI